MKWWRSKVLYRSHGYLDSGTIRSFYDSGVPHDLIRDGGVDPRRGGNEGNAYFGDLADQSDRTTDVVGHSGTVHAGCDIGHVVVLARGKGAESTRRDSIPLYLHVTAFCGYSDPPVALRLNANVFTQVGQDEPIGKCFPYRVGRIGPEPFVGWEG